MLDTSYVHKCQLYFQMPVINGLKIEQWKYVYNNTQSKIVRKKKNIIRKLQWKGLCGGWNLRWEFSDPVCPFLLWENVNILPDVAGLLQVVTASQRVTAVQLRAHCCTAIMVVVQVYDYTHHHLFKGWTLWHVSYMWGPYWAVPLSHTKLKY